MKYLDITQMPAADLRKALTDLQEKVQNLRMKTKLGQVKNMHELALAKKDIARILTYLNTNNQ